MPNQFHRFANEIARVILLLALLISTPRPSTAQSSGKAPYLDPTQPIGVRVDDLVSRMTLEEKASQLVNQSRAIPRGSFLPALT
jgi:beta-glucosidase